MIKIRNEISKRGQVAVFAILGILLIAAIALLFLLKKPPVAPVIPEQDPEGFIEGCTKDAVREAIEILSEQGGDIEPKSDFLYNGKKVSYLCYNENYYEPCINQRPMLIQYIENEIEGYIEPKIEQCFQKLKIEMEKKYNIEMKEMELKVELEPKRAIAEIKRYLKISREGNVKEIENFRASAIDPIYELAGIASEITNQEAKFCYFEYIGYQLLYPEFEIKKREIDGEKKVYEIMEEKSGRKFAFAIRSCAMPAGI